MLQGSCVCGAVTFEVDEPFRIFQYCHCGRCQKATGTAFRSSVFVSIDQFRWTSGEDSVTFYDLPEAKYWRHGFCSTCGSAAPCPTKPGTMIMVPAGALDDAPSQGPSQSIMWASRAEWYSAPEGLPLHDGYPPRAADK